MASVQDLIAEKTNSLSSKTDDLWSLFMHGGKAYIDKETRADDKPAAGVEDLVYQGGYAVPLQQNGSQSSMPMMAIAAAGVVGVVLLVMVLKKR